MGKSNNINKLFSKIFGPDKDKQLSTKEKKESLRSYYGVAGLDEKILESKFGSEEEKVALEKRVKVLIEENNKKLSPMLQEIVKKTQFAINEDNK